MELLLCVTTEAVLAFVVKRVSVQVAREYYGDPIRDGHVGSFYVYMWLCNFSVGI